MAESKTNLVGVILVEVTPNKKMGCVSGGETNLVSPIYKDMLHLVSFEKIEQHLSAIGWEKTKKTTERDYATFPRKAGMSLVIFVQKCED